LAWSSNGPLAAGDEELVSQAVFLNAQPAELPALAAPTPSPGADELPLVHPAPLPGPESLDSPEPSLPPGTVGGMPMRSPANPQTEPPSILAGEFRPIDLAAALALAGAQNPELLVARQRVVEAAAMRQYMAAQILPNLNLGMNYDDHTGTLQQSSGRIIDVTRGSLYVGAGANAVAAGSVNIPGVQWNLNVSQGIYNYLANRQTVQTRQLANLAVRNDVILRVSTAYVDLLRATARRAVALQVRDDTAEVARLTAAYAEAGQGRAADANRAATELRQRIADVAMYEGEMLTASARLNQLLNLDPALRLQPNDGWIVPAPIVPAPIALSELIAMALLTRPDLASQRSAVREALYALDSARMLPFSPTTMVGYSGGMFGGGSNRQDLGANLFGNFDGRSDVDVVLYWTLANCGIGNRAQIEAARARMRQADFQAVVVLNRARAEVASAYARSQARWAQIEIGEQAVRSGVDAFRGDLIRIRGREGLPIEVLDSLRLLARARFEYLNAIADYDRAQFELYVALGQPRADLLARPAPEKAAAPFGAVDPEPLPPVDNQ
jgi:outer membrane protein TolC